MFFIVKYVKFYTLSEQKYIYIVHAFSTDMKWNGHLESTATVTAWKIGSLCCQIFPVRINLAHL